MYSVRTVVAVGSVICAVASANGAVVSVLSYSVSMRFSETFEHRSDSFPASELLIKMPSLLRRVSSCFALITHQIAVRR